MEVSDPRFSEAHVRHYADHGYVIVERFLEASELDGALAEIDRLLPGWVDYCNGSRSAKPDGWDEGRPRYPLDPTRFPFPGEHLNRITLHPELRRFAALQVGHDDLFCEQSSLSVKCAGHNADREQHMHCDYGNHTLAYPPDDPGYWQTAYLLYYTDVTLEHAPTAVCSWQHYRGELLVPAVVSPETRPELYAHEVKTIVPAGALLAYSMRTFHRGTRFLGEGGRLAHFITYAPAAWKWLGITGWPEHGIRAEFNAWIESATPEERCLLGFPPPGHVYWTEETLAGVAARYPGMDMRPYWRAAR